MQIRGGECVRDVGDGFDFMREPSRLNHADEQRPQPVILKSFDSPDEVRVMQKGKFEAGPPRRNHNRQGDV
jgi:hypothetical protein